MALDLIGTKSGYLTVTGYEGRTWQQSSRTWRTLWKVKCICGKEVIKPTQALRGSKAAQTCGCCEWHIHHNEAYVSWMAMKGRCDNKRNKDYPNYGGRGITYDFRWRKFIPFFLDMGDPPVDPKTGERLSLDRKDNNGNYNKDNCKWSTRSEQQCNKQDGKEHRYAF